MKDFSKLKNHLYANQAQVLSQQTSTSQVKSIPVSSAGSQSNSFM